MDNTTVLTNPRTRSQGGLTSGRQPVVKIIAESLSQHDEKHVVPTPLSVGKGRKKKTTVLIWTIIIIHGIFYVLPLYLTDSVVLWILGLHGTTSLKMHRYDGVYYSTLNLYS
jgi:hypothetical protein